MITDDVQKACDYSVSQIVRQGSACTDGDGACIYANSEGMRCAIGWLLDISDNSLATIDLGILGLVKAYPSKVPTVIKDNLEIFKSLQNFHDWSYIGSRIKAKNKLKDRGVDTSAAHWTAWVRMGSKSLDQGL